MFDADHYFSNFVSSHKYQINNFEEFVCQILNELLRNEIELHKNKGETSFQRREICKVLLEIHPHRWSLDMVRLIIMVDLITILFLG